MVELVRSETVLCLLCGCAAHTLVYTTRDRLCGVPGEFRLVRCTQCDLVYLSPRPTPADIGQYYPQRYDPFMSQRLDEMPPLSEVEHPLRFAQALPPGPPLSGARAAAGRGVRHGPVPG